MCAGGLMRLARPLSPGLTYMQALVITGLGVDRGRSGGLSALRVLR